ncbi:hypothetical protein KVV02_003537 [Mortierella alpina]|uniref:BHLH domain-containing protein n=1 Tax=Mortierella alpina TaxID=64518 RepID=A0A9P8A7T4_MORAP|nr:hypothetical protein KVV02_003537 [Mortierella alpina]
MLRMALASRSSLFQSSSSPTASNRDRSHTVPQSTPTAHSTDSDPHSHTCAHNTYLFSNNSTPSTYPNTSIMPQASFHNQTSRSPLHRMSTDDAPDSHPHTHAYTNPETTSYDRQQPRNHPANYPSAQPSDLLASPMHKRPSYSEQHHDYSHREPSYQSYPNSEFHADAHPATYERPSRSPTDSPMSYYGHDQQQQQHAHVPSRRTPHESASMVNTARRFSEEDENNMYLPHFHAGQGHHPENTTTTMIPNSSHVGGSMTSPSTLRTAAPGHSPLSPQSPPTAAQGAQAAAATYSSQSPHSRSPQTPPQTPSPRKFARSGQQPPRHYHYHPHHHQQQHHPPHHHPPHHHDPPHHHHHQPHQASRQQDLPVAAATASHSKQGSTVGPNRRLAHILSEQKRREKINGGFDELKSVIPDCAENADSKAMILKKATAYILMLEDELKRYADICQQYPHLNTTLNHQDRKGDQEH